MIRAVDSDPESQTESVECESRRDANCSNNIKRSPRSAPAYVETAESGAARRERGACVRGACVPGCLRLYLRCTHRSVESRSCALETSLWKLSAGFCPSFLETGWLARLSFQKETEKSHTRGAGVGGVYALYLVVEVELTISRNLPFMTHVLTPNPKISIKWTHPDLQTRRLLSNLELRLRRA